MKVSDLMSKDVATVTRDAALKDVARLLVERGISGVPVVEGDHVVGVVSERDLLFKQQPSSGVHRGVLAWLMDETEVTLKLDARTAQEAMSRPPVTIASGRPVADAAKLMLDEGISRLPVVDSGRLVGILTEGDLVRAFARPDDEIREEILDDTILRTLWQPPGVFDLEVHDGEVTISGAVATKDQVHEVERLVDRVPGVVAVDARLDWPGAS
jgi:CBS domain-containing protein